MSPALHIEQPEHIPQGFAPYTGAPIRWPPQIFGLDEASAASDTASVAESHEGVVNSEFSDLSDTCSENEV